MPTREEQQRRMREAAERTRLRRTERATQDARAAGRPTEGAQVRGGRLRMPGQAAGPTLRGTAGIALRGAAGAPGVLAAAPGAALAADDAMVGRFGPGPSVDFQEGLRSRYQESMDRVASTPIAASAEERRVQRDQEREQFLRAQRERENARALPLRSPPVVREEPSTQALDVDDVPRPGTPGAPQAPGALAAADDPAEPATPMLSASAEDQASLRRRLGTEGQQGTLNVMPAEAVTSLDPATRRQLSAARQAAAERGDWDAVRRSYMTPAERTATDAEARLRREATESRGTRQTLGQMMQERLRRRGARRELESMEMGRAQEGQARQQAFDNAVTLQRLELEQQRLGRDLNADERSRLDQSTQRVRDTIDRLTQYTSNGETQTDVRQRNWLDAFMGRDDVELTQAGVQRGVDIYTTIQELDDLAEDASTRSWLRRGAGGAAVVAGVLLAARGGTLGRRAAGAATGLAGLTQVGPGGTEYPTFDTPGEAIDELKAMRDAGMTSRWWQSGERMQWRDEDVDPAAMPAEVRQRMERLMRLLPD